MKSIFMSIVLGLALLFPNVAYAESFNANITDGGIYVSGDIFGCENMIPGDTYSNDITLKNTTSNTQKVYMFMDYKPSATEADKAFADLVDVDMVSGNKVVHDGSISEIISNDEPIFVATLKPGESSTIDIDLVYSFDAHETHANGLANVDWKLHSEVVNNSSSSDNSGNNHDNTSDNGNTSDGSNISDGNNPTNNYPGVGKDGPGKTAPQTGQELAMFALGGLGLLAVIFAVIAAKRKKDKEQIDS